MNLTIAVENEVLKCARIRAAEENTSVNAVLRDYLSAYAGLNRRERQGVERLLHLSKTCRGGRGAAHWTRDELHER